MDLNAVHALCNGVRDQVRTVVVGQENAVELLLVALLSEGHVLLEGVPGTAKTMLARAFAAGLGVQFSRIQFTPDLMPGDLLGTNLFNFQTNQFVLTKGPIFTQFLLADELNRTPPKTQAALLQAMQERAVTLDGVTHALGPGFMVVATQNPIEQEGTYPLPEAQLDRFLFKVGIDYPTRDEERTMVALSGSRSNEAALSQIAPPPWFSLQHLVAIRQTIGQFRLDPAIIDYIVDLVRATRQSPSLRCGASPRSANLLATAARARAALQGRDFVIPDDVKMLVRPALAHRLVLAPSAEIEGVSLESTISQILDQVPAPR